MKSPKEEQLEGLVKKMVKEAGLDSPSPNFTHKVLAEIGKMESRSPELIYKPLINKGFWIFLAAAGVGLISYAIWGNLQVEWLSMVLGDRLSAPEFFKIFYQWSVPSSMVYGALVIFGFVYLQVYLVRNSWDKFYKIN